MSLIAAFRCSCLVTAALLLPEIAPAAPDFAVSTNTLPGLQSVSADNPAFRYEGRFDMKDPAAPVVVWQASRIAVDFTGPRLVLLFDRLDGECHFNAAIDGTNHLLSLRDPAVRAYELQPPPGPGAHRLVLFKRSEAAAGYAAFLGIEIAPDARVSPPAQAVPPFRMMFFGDSITAGACNEDGAQDQWKDRSTHNNALSYGAMTAEAFHADYRNIAVSGMGVSTGWVGVRAIEMWNKLYPKADSAPANLESWKPQVLFINLGENDNSFTSAKHQPFPPTFTENYVALVRAFRAAWPDSQVVLLRGGMFGGSQSAALREAWQKVIDKLEPGDPRIHHFAFQHWSGNHPRVADDRAMADELIAWLRTQPFMPRD